MTTRALTPAEISRLSSALLERHRHRDRLFLLLAVTTSFRVSELLTLRFSQLLTAQVQVAKEMTITRRLMKGGHGVHAKSVRSRRVSLSETARTAAPIISPPCRSAHRDTLVFRSRQRAQQTHHPLAGPMRS